MPSYGRQTFNTTGYPIMVSADDEPEYKIGGVTVDWATVTAVSGSDATYGDGTVVKIGQKGIEYGTVLVLITASGKYGPADTTASDGRQTLARGKCFILNETVVQYPASGFATTPSDHPAVIEGGQVWRARLKIGGTNQPTVSNFEAAFPRIRYVDL